MAVQREELLMETRAQWRAWLAAHGTTSPGVWLMTWKRSSGRPVLAYEDLVEEALCFGWVDSVPRQRDDDFGMLRLSPRKARSAWSKVNKARVGRLVKAGRMAPPGLAKIEAAKRDGSWTALDAVEALEVPDDLARALKKNATARRHFETFPPGSRKIILTWIASARKAETRAARVAETVRLAAENRRANDPRG